MADEIPELGKFVIQSFDSENLAFPIVVVSRDPTIGGYVKPTIGDACTDPRFAATHTFVGVTVTHLDNRVIWTYRKLPGPILTGHHNGADIRGRVVDITTQEGASGALAVETGNLILASDVDPLSTVVDRRTTKKVASLPPEEVSSFWQDVPLPTLIFSITNTIFCNNSQFASLVTNPVKGGGSSVLRKHRKTVSYSATLPNPDLSGVAFTVTDLEYRGKMIQFSYQNVLNDAISYSQTLALTSGGSACAWTEAYSFSASTPSATTFAAGAWYTRSFIPEPFGDSMWKTTKIEYYSASGNPSI